MHRSVRKVGARATTYEGADNSIVFGILNDPQNFLGSAIDILTDSTDEDDILPGWVAYFSTDLNRQSLVFANNSGTTSSQPRN